MGRTMLLCLIGSITAFSILIDLAMSIASYMLHENSSNEHIPSKRSSISLTAVNLILVGLLSYRLVLESETQTTEWSLWNFRAQALFSLIIFINIGIISSERMHLFFSSPASSSSSVWLSLSMAHGVVWTISAYCQGFLCALSFVLSNICYRLSHPSIDIGRPTNLISPQIPQRRNLLSPVPSFLDPLPSPQSEMSVRTSILRSPLPNYHTCKEPEPLVLQTRSRERSVRSIPSMDTVIQCPESSNEHSAKPSYRLTMALGPRDSLSILEKNIHPIFRPSTPHPSPMPNMSTSIIAPESHDQMTESLPGQASIRSCRLRRQSSFYVLNGTARNSLMRYEDSKV